MQCYLVGDLDHCERLPQFSKLYSELPVHPCSFFQCSLGGSSVSPRAHRNRYWTAKLQDLGQIGANRRRMQGEMWAAAEVTKLSPLKGCSRIYFSIAIMKLSAKNASQRVKATRFGKRSLLLRRLVLRQKHCLTLFLTPKRLVDNSLVSKSNSPHPAHKTWKWK
jgi:hypothetical protein